MKRMAKTDLTLEAILSAIADGATSLTAVSKALGLSKGSVSGSTAKAIRKLLPDIDKLLTDNKKTQGGTEAGKAKAAKVSKKAAKDKPAKVSKAKVKPVPQKAGKWARDPRNPFREGAYGTCFDILAAPAHKDGLLKDKLIQLLGEATGKDAKHAGYDAQVLLSAHPNDNGLSNNDSPRHRSCRPGFFVMRTNGHVQLMVDKT